MERGPGQQQPFVDEHGALEIKGKNVIIKVFLFYLFNFKIVILYGFIYDYSC